MLPKELEKVYKQYLKEKPGTYKIPEPPRGGSIRLYNPKGEIPFIVIGTPVDRWISLASKLDLTRNYWEKTPISDEQLWVFNTRLYLVHPTAEQYFQVWDGAIKVGEALFAEDEYNNEFLLGARDLGQMQREELVRTYEQRLIVGLAGIEPLPTMPVKKRRGRPRKNKEQANEIK